MKMLMIGMDGVKIETFERGWTPYIRSLIEEGDCLQLKEDLVSRGWSEIVLGKHALYTGAVYEGPLADGTLTWSDKFKMSDVPGLGDEIKPIWQILNERGYRVGIMNVPTTYPAPEVDGFFVSGGGGGGPISQNASAEQCHPKGLDKKLNDLGYIVDERLPTLLNEQGLYEPDAFFERLDLMNERRTNVFIQLSKECKIDFGFVVYKSSTVTAETLLLPELEKKESGLCTVNDIFISAAEEFYRRLDRHIQSLIESFPDAKILLVSDHSMSTRHYAVNPNAFLVEAGFQTHSSGKQQLFKTAKSIKHLVPNWLKKILKNNSNIKSAYESMVTFDAKKTLAFCQAFSNGAHGIYINDTERFGGPVNTKDIESLVERIVKDFNDHPESKKHGFHAYLKPMRGEGPTIKKFPDIILDLPDGYHTSNLFPMFVYKTELPKKPFNLREMNKDPRTVGKAHEPLAVCLKDKWQSEDFSAGDLTMVYHHITQIFK